MAKGQTTDQSRLDREHSKDRREALQKGTDMAEVMGLASGRRMMYRLIYEECGLQDVYLAQDSGIYKHEGKRGVGAKLALDLQTNHSEAYILMITERMRVLKYNSQIRDEPKSIGDEP